MFASTSHSETAKLGALTKASWWRRFRSGKATYVGIDIGVDSVDLSVFGRDAAHNGSLGWQSQTGFTLPVDPTSPPKPNWVDVVVDALDESLPRCVDAGEIVTYVSLPAPWIHYQTTTEAELALSKQQCDAMFSGSKFACPSHISSWPIVVGKEHRMVAATADSAACRVTEVIMDLGYQVQCILPQGVALLGAARELTTLSPSAMLLLEYSGALIAMPSEAGCGLCRNIRGFDKPMSHTPSLAEIEPWLEEIAEELLASSRYVSRLGGRLDDRSPVMVCGSIATIQGVDSALASMLNRPVATWRYAGRQRPERQHSVGTNMRGDAAHAVSLSLACGAIESSSESGGGAR